MSKPTITQTEFEALCHTLRKGILIEAHEAKWRASETAMALSNVERSVLKKFKIAKAKKRDAGATLLEVALFLLVFAAIMASLGTFGIIARQAIENLQSIGACIQALLECRNI